MPPRGVTQDYLITFYHPATWVSDGEGGRTRTGPPSRGKFRKGHKETALHEAERMHGLNPGSDIRVFFAPTGNPGAKKMIKQYIGNAPAPA